MEAVKAKNEALEKEMATYRDLLASQDEQFSLLYIKEVNAQAVSW